MGTFLNLIWASLVVYTYFRPDDLLAVGTLNWGAFAIFIMASLFTILTVDPRFRAVLKKHGPNKTHVFLDRFYDVLLLSMMWMSGHTIAFGFYLGQFALLMYIIQTSMGTEGETKPSS